MVKDIYYVYNNEAIASCLFLSILQKVESLDIPRACLVLPFLLDDRTVSRLEKKGEMDLEDFVSQQPNIFVTFNKRFLALLPVAINSLMLLSKSGQILIGDHIRAKSNLSLEAMEMGDRFQKLVGITPRFLTLIEKYPTDQLYKILNVRL
ncbi:MAG: hypothetical protein H6581_07970 [Bacteroidia bacterium]|nr:hypothetical protein [Bacteroidia bacterium]